MMQSFDHGYYVLVKSIQELREKKEGLVTVGIGGPSGSGKTRLNIYFFFHFQNFYSCISVALFDTFWFYFFVVWWSVKLSREGGFCNWLCCYINGELSHGIWWWEWFGFNWFRCTDTKSWGLHFLLKFCYLIGLDFACGNSVIYS